ncbi:MAG: hypothetical protein R3A49_00775 [Acidimicrobiia bacterium]
MFVQIIEGRVSDPDTLKRQIDRWEAELRPGATGHLGATGGVAADGRAVLLARFESAAAAEANSKRPEQGEWWAETEKCFDGDVGFADSDDVDVWLGGGSDDAGFVQIMKGSGDRDRAREMDALLTERMADYRPDVLGGFRVWTGPDTAVEVAYFESEEAARAGEKKEPPPDLAAAMAELGDDAADVDYIDLTDPWLY